MLETDIQQRQRVSQKQGDSNLLGKNTDLQTKFKKIGPLGIFSAVTLEGKNPDFLNCYFFIVSQINVLA